MFKVKISRFHAVLFLALGLTLALKVFGVSKVDPPGYQTVLSTLEPFFQAQGFDSSGIIDDVGIPSLLVARKDCYMRIASVAVEGAHEVSFTRSLPAGFRPLFYFNFRIYEDRQPTTLPIFYFYVAKILRLNGLDVGYPPVLGLGVTSACEPKTLPWEELPKVPFTVF